MDSLSWLDPESDLWRRGDGDDGNGFGDGGGGGGFGSFNKGNDTSHSAFINDLRFQAAKSIRTSTMILAAFNVVAALATALGILWDSYATKKRNDPNFRMRTSGLTFVSPTETFPLVMSIGIMIQGITFASVQSAGLESMMVLGCTIPSQMMLPAVLMVPYIQFVFGLEIVSRAFRQIPFPKRGKWNVLVCLVVLGTLLLITFLVTHFIRPQNVCFGSLFWFVRRWRMGIFVIFILIAVILLACVGILIWKLHAHCRIEDTERKVASRMVYFLGIGVIFIVLQIPFFYSIIFSDLRSSGPRPLNLSMIAAVVANLTGLANGGLHLFLRANCFGTIGSVDRCEKERKKLKEGIKVTTPKDADYPPTSGDFGAPPVNRSVPPRQRAISTSSSHYGKEEEEVESPRGTATYENRDPLRSQNVYSTATMPRLNEPLPPPPTLPMSKMESIKAQIRKSTQSVFKRDSGSKQECLLPATTYSPKGLSEKALEDDMQTLMPPPLVYGNGLGVHKRNSSVQSHATVQIGMRFSNADDATRLNSRYLDKFSNFENPSDRGLAKYSTPLVDDEGTLVASTFRDSAAKSYYASDPSRPATPSLAPPTLTAAVYTPRSPVRRVTSPKGVGFNEPPKRSNSNNEGSKADRPKCFKSNCSCDGLHKKDWI